MNSIASAPARASRSASPWWREPMMWLVVGGPLLVILACAVTITLAIKHPDPVLPRGGAVGSAASPDDEGALTRMPAHQARNHTATPATALPRDDAK